ncbi:hypothetical protein AVEN_266697-1 [Araneus ventricosus]|uniref:Uncharacterized protein n=1 Tax=Araneus ventricosus TaxID=182803 RepID=A0A4Y2PTA6_ARAVE|nr:hypothetical protein AVEN_266697-1 [Araneus ventricosus]
MLSLQRKVNQVYELFNYFTLKEPEKLVHLPNIGRIYQTHRVQSNLMWYGSWLMSESILEAHQPSVPVARYKSDRRVGWRSLRQQCVQGIYSVQNDSNNVHEEIVSPEASATRSLEVLAQTLSTSRFVVNQLRVTGKILLWKTSRHRKLDKFVAWQT